MNPYNSSHNIIHTTTLQHYLLLCLLLFTHTHYFTTILVFTDNILIYTTPGTDATNRDEQHIA